MIEDFIKLIFETLHQPLYIENSNLKGTITKRSLESSCN